MAGLVPDANPRVLQPNACTSVLDFVAAQARRSPEAVALLRPARGPLTHRNLFSSAENVGRALRLVESDLCLNLMPLFHIFWTCKEACVKRMGSRFSLPPDRFEIFRKPDPASTVLDVRGSDALWHPAAGKRAGPEGRCASPSPKDDWTVAFGPV
jgi:hypothetical protein